MLKQKELIHNEKWDILIVLDACRYDIFRGIYKDILGDCGKLYKAKVKSNWTFGWFVDTFYNMPKLDDVTFVSSSPSVDSENVKIYDKKKRKIYGEIEFNAKNYFKEMIDISQKDFDSKYGIVFPEKVTDKVIDNLEKKGRIICKYFQIHDPYLYHINRGLIEETNISDFDALDKKMSKGHELKKIISFFMSDVTFWKFRKMLNKPPICGMGSLWIKYGTDGIRKAYIEDMKYVLNDIKRILLKSKGKKVVITGDHGESLGEQGYFGHGDRMTKEVKTVPWLVIDVA